MNEASLLDKSDGPEELGFLEIAVLVFSVYVIFALTIQTFFTLPPNVNNLINEADWLVCGVFLVDFIVRFRRAASKMSFMKWGWLDLVSCIPSVDFLRWGRIPRAFRILRMIRAFRSARTLVQFIYRNRVRSLLGTATLTSVMLVLFSSVAVLAFEDTAESNIKTPFDAVWWAIATITTVGYGDKYPVTIEGRLVAIVLMVTGVGLFGVMTGLFAHIFVERESKKEELSEMRTLAAEVRLLQEAILRMDERSTHRMHNSEENAEEKSIPKKE